VADADERAGMKTVDSVNTGDLKGNAIRTWGQWPVFTGVRSNGPSNTRQNLLPAWH